MSAAPALTLDDYRAIRDTLLAARDWSWTAVAGAGGEDAYYRCRYCQGTGPWPGAIVHRAVHTDGGPLPCRVLRAREVLPALIRWIQGQEPRSGESPVVGGERW